MEKLRALVDAQVEDREIVGIPEDESPPTINLMDALRQSVAGKKRLVRKPKERMSGTPAL
jgi:non-homologous end joining protein Ku